MDNGSIDEQGSGVAGCSGAFEQHSPASVMTRTVLEQAPPVDWIDDVFDTRRRHQYARELLLSTIVELLTRVALGVRPSLHAAARRSEDLPVSLTALYNTVKRSEPDIPETVVRGSAERLAPVMAGLGNEASLPGWTLRVLDGDHFFRWREAHRAVARPPRRGSARPGPGGLRPGQRPRARHTLRVPEPLAGSAHAEPDVLCVAEAGLDRPAVRPNRFLMAPSSRS